MDLGSIRRARRPCSRRRDRRFDRRAAARRRTPAPSRTRARLQSTIRATASDARQRGRPPAVHCHAKRDGPIPGHAIHGSLQGIDVLALGLQFSLSLVALSAFSQRAGERLGRAPTRAPPESGGAAVGRELALDGPRNALTGTEDISLRESGLLRSGALMRRRRRATASGLEAGRPAPGAQSQLDTKPCARLSPSSRRSPDRG